MSVQVEVVSEEEEEEDVIPLPTDKYKPASLEKMITLVASLVEKSRGPDHLLQLSTEDFNAIAGGKVSILETWARSVVFGRICLPQPIKNFLLL
jgi:hypothetical protein